MRRWPLSSTGYRRISGRASSVSSTIEIAGPQQAHEPYVKHLQGPLWEMRMKGRDGIARAAYVTVVERRVVVVRVFPKRTQKTPRREIELALRRATEVR